MITKTSLLAVAFAAVSFPLNAQSLFVKQTDGTVHEYSLDALQPAHLGESPESIGTCAITYIANDGTENTFALTGLAGKVLAVGADVPFERTDYIISGWNTAADGSGVQCSAGELLSIGRDVTLYAQWQPKPTKGLENNREWVDLGLPSGLKWATCNVGAAAPEGCGDYFAWGETETKADYTWQTYKHCAGSEKSQTKYCPDAAYGNDGFTDGKHQLEPQDDAARHNWGGTWRMPTASELRELLDHCTWTWTTLNGVVGYEVKSRQNGNSIFLPAAGCVYGTERIYLGEWGSYRSSSLSVDSPGDDYYIYFGPTKRYWSYNYRSYGRPVRAVCE